MSSFFENEEVKKVLLDRAKTSDKECGACFTIGDENGRFTKEYRRWKMWKVFVAASAKKTDEEKAQWLIDNPEPEKYEK
tara:strand:- start:3267 stop:3503 length:237 start_codon:yes stop_codon:yes gene_type:complete